MKRTTKEIDKLTNMLTNFIIQHSDAKREDADIIAFGAKFQGISEIHAKIRRFLPYLKRSWV